MLTLPPLTDGNGGGQYLGVHTQAGQLACFLMTFSYSLVGGAVGSLLPLYSH